MDRFTNDELAEALHIVTSTISKCEKMQLKFPEGTSQHTLLKNRIKALHISKSLLTNDSVWDKYTKEEFIQALPPVSSIISKCEKAQLKFSAGTSNHTRLKHIIDAMHISKSLMVKHHQKRSKIG